MDAQTLGALATIVNEAIAKAVGPLQAKITELEGRKAYDERPILRSLESVVKEQGEVKSLIQRMHASTPAAYDDAGLIARLGKQLEALREEIPAAYDDTAVREQIADLTIRTDAHAGIVKGYADSLPKAYDDTALRRDLTSAIRVLEDSNERLKSLEARPEPAAPRNGTDGRDALHLEVLPAIDEQKSYARGTYAKHAGGLWRSFEQTSGLRGWECIVDGIADVVISPSDEDPRVVGVEIKRASGASHAVVIAVPAMVYKGVFDGGEYLEGDTVTWAGSLWHCNVTATKAKPGDGSTDWTLAVKKGRDGKEVVTVARPEGVVKL